MPESRPAIIEAPNRPEAGLPHKARHPNPTRMGHTLWEGRLAPMFAPNRPEAGLPQDPDCFVQIGRSTP
jgi:hypothetical protein